MGSMKIAISVPDSLFKAADALAQQQQKSRSQFYTEAVAAYVGSQSADAVREQLNEIYAVHDSSPDAVLSALALETIDPNETW
jgi:metal-responsive CopG/Arc/MetJ family transcriptional regulator